MTNATCRCGCGASVRSGREYRRGHNPARTKPLAITEADYRVEDRGYETPCWIWRHYLDRKGYPILNRVGASTNRAHRIAYELAVGPIPAGLTLDHLCLQHACVRPSHLEPVTRTENVRRARSPLIDPAEAEELRRLRAEGASFRTLARRFAISNATVAAVIARRYPYGH